jgi:hypothetical protein
MAGKPGVLVHHCRSLRYFRRPIHVLNELRRRLRVSAGAKLLGRRLLGVD